MHSKVSQLKSLKFKVQNLVTEMEFYIKKSQFRVKSQESRCVDGGHSYFTVYIFFPHSVLDISVGRVKIDICSMRASMMYVCVFPLY